jgi:hypothetical protein
MKHTGNDRDTKCGVPVASEGTGQLTAEQIEHVRKLIDAAGGVDNARRAIEALEKLRPAA